MSRRLFLHGVLGGTAALCLPRIATAQPRPDPRRPLRVGVEPSLLAGGLPRHLSRRMAADIGIGLQMQPSPSLRALVELDAGELDAVITNAPPQETAQVAAGLAHDRRFLVRTDFVIVGPVDQGKDPAGLRQPGRPVADDALQALQAIAGAAALQRARFISPSIDTGAWVRERALWAAMGVDPDKNFQSGAYAGWYSAAPAGQDALAHAAQQQAYTLVDRPHFMRQPPPGMAVLVSDPQQLDCSYHLLQGFRVRHPAARLAFDWLTGRNGRRAAAGFRVGGVVYATTPVAATPS